MTSRGGGKAMRLLRAALPHLVLAIALAAPAAASEGGGGHEPSLDLRSIGFKGFNVAVLFGALIYFLREPVTAFFSGRRDEIGRELAEARRAREEAEAKLRLADEQLARAAAEAADLLKKAEEEALAEREQITRAAQEEAARLTQVAHQEIRQATEIARRELQAHTAKLATEHARELLVAGMSDADRDRLLDGYVQRLGPALAS